MVTPITAARRTLVPTSTAGIGPKWNASGQAGPRGLGGTTMSHTQVPLAATPLPASSSSAHGL
jgi:hypothetical protein